MTPLRLFLLLTACLAAAPLPAQTLAPAPPRPSASPPPPASAQASATRPGASLGNHDSNAPVDIDADRLEVQDRADRAIWTGNVRAVQSDMTLTAPRVMAAYTKTPSPAAAGTPPKPGAQTGSNVQINRLDATGGVVVRSPTETATGNVAIYDLDRRLITMLGNVSLLREGNRVNGGRLVWDLNSGRATVDGSAVADGAGGISTGRGGRVSGHFTVQQKND